jgi:hypothetical protein
MVGKPPKAIREKEDIVFDVDSAAALIAQTQTPDGEIPWSPGDKTDPWDHVEAAMGLSIGGYYPESRLAFLWLAHNQLEDGSWYASYRDGAPEDMTRESNMAAYIAVGLYHYYLITGDIAFLRDMWNSMSAAIDFAIDFQTEDGAVYWAKSPDGIIDPMALLTGSSSIYMSLKCAISIADRLGHPRPIWHRAMGRLGEAIRFKPHLFSAAKSRFSMDWFYPILCGAIRGVEAQKRIDRYWDKFVIQDQGVRCVSDEPWVTMAETSELCLALAAMGNYDLSEVVLDWISEKRFRDGSFWCGHTYPDMTIWPEEKVTWTNAVVLMAADALYRLTPAGCLFDHRFWHGSGDSLRIPSAKDHSPMGILEDYLPE